MGVGRNDRVDRIWDPDPSWKTVWRTGGPLPFGQSCNMADGGRCAGVSGCNYVSKGNDHSRFGHPGAGFCFIYGIGCHHDRCRCIRFDIPGICASRCLYMDRMFTGLVRDQDDLVFQICRCAGG